MQYSVTILEISVWQHFSSVATVAKTLCNFLYVAGAGVFVTTVIAGSVCIIQPFKIMERPFLRDVIFYTGSVFFTFCILYDGKITTLEAIGNYKTCLIKVIIYW